ncbi:hypothetical protein A2U01_0043271 [Trifolium medium]|uniref:Uncharacterized protein n=1 Tax=Trifolium medium TaxID=97028 RepID=A0A392QF05_9FABA|nr:hypothetical protein [Trifolium medium]
MVFLLPPDIPICFCVLLGHDGHLQWAVYASSLTSGARGMRLTQQEGGESLVSTDMPTRLFDVAVSCWRDCRRLRRLHNLGCSSLCVVLLEAFHEPDFLKT